MLIWYLPADVLETVAVLKNSELRSFSTMILLLMVVVLILVSKNSGSKSGLCRLVLIQPIAGRNISDVS